jgi:hypothetical protein
MLSLNLCIQLVVSFICSDSSLMEYLRLKSKIIISHKEEEILDDREEDGRVVSETERSNKSLLSSR